MGKEVKKGRQSNKRLKEGETEKWRKCERTFQMRNDDTSHRWQLRCSLHHLMEVVRTREEEEGKREEEGREESKGKGSRRFGNEDEGE